MLRAAMGMHGVLCALSAKRRAMLEEDPELFSEVLAAREHERVPGLLDLDKSWHALDVLLGEGDDEVLGDAILGRSGRSFGPSLSFGRPKLLEPARVAEIASALAALPDDLVDRRYAALARRNVHGGYGPKPHGDDELDGLVDDETEEREELRARLERVQAFYRDAAQRGDAVIAVVV